jgi:hypothetical protein
MQATAGLNAGGLGYGVVRDACGTSAAPKALAYPTASIKAETALPLSPDFKPTATKSTPRLLKLHTLSHLCV